jgi:hypothetical protein
LPPYTLTEDEWEVEYNKTDTRIYRKYGNDKDKSADCRKDGRTRYSAINHLIGKGLIPVSYTDFRI